MKIFPAIDIMDGKVVRLVMGSYDNSTVYSDDPLAIAKGFEEAGAGHIHIVDLDGAREGTPANFEIIEAIKSKTDLWVQVGGGIRDMKKADRYINTGIDRIILGTAAIKNPDFLNDALDIHGEKIDVGIDARDGNIAVNGWKETTKINAISYAKMLARKGVAAIIFTDISKDGMLGGTNSELYKKLSEIPKMEIIASGGVTYMEEIGELSGYVSGVIIGKALYDGKLDLAEVIKTYEGN